MRSFVKNSLEIFCQRLDSSSSKSSERILIFNLVYICSLHGVLDPATVIIDTENGNGHQP